MRSAGYLESESNDRVRVVLGNRHAVKLLSRYADAAATCPLALIGSRGYLEIAVNSGSAQALFAAENGNRVQVFWDK